MRLRGLKIVGHILCLFIAFIFAVPAYAEVVLDGTLGTKGSVTGPNFNITSAMGQIYGGNLFHSFSAFNLANGENATFSNSSTATITNIISRVTGGQASSIDGTIKSTITGADFWFINPSGIVFGHNAKLDVGGSFHASTADYIRLGDDNRFDASNPATPILTSALPAAFGFLGSNPQSISINGSFLKVPEGKTLSLVGGNLDIQNSNLFASSGTINLISIASVGEAVVDKQNFKVDSFGKFGEINIKEARTESEKPVYDFNPKYKMGNVDTSGTGGGKIFIRGGKLFVDGGYVFADTYGDIDSLGIDIHVTDSISVSGVGLISSETVGKGNAGNISIDTAKLDITDVAQISTSAMKGSGGDAGDITIMATDSVYISHRFVNGYSAFARSISSEAFGKGNSGNININTTKLNISDGADISTSAWEDSEGKSGSISIETTKLDISGGSQISTSAKGDVGAITIKATDSVIISGELSAIGCVKKGDGKGGDINIDTTTLYISGGAFIASNAATNTNGDAGNITIKATDSVVLLGIDGGISSRAGGDGNGGSINIETTKLYISEGASIYSDAWGKGKGGAISVNTGILNLNNSGKISAESTGSGNAGAIDITLDTMKLVDSSITTAADSAGGGQISITAGHMINLINSETTATVAGGTSSGGNVNLTAPFLILNKSKVVAKADEGKGGNISLKTDTYIRSLDSEVSASSRLGIDGTVYESTAAIDLTGKVALAQVAYTDTAALAPKQCVEREEELSSFTVKGRDGLPPFPDSLLAIP